MNVRPVAKRIGEKKTMTATVDRIAFEKIRKKIIIASWAFIAAMFVFVFFLMPSAHAWSEGNAQQIRDVQDICMGVLPIITDTVFGTGSEGALNSGFHQMYQECVEGTGGTISTFIGGVMKGCMFIGGAFALVVAAMHFLARMDRGEDMFEAVLKIIIEIIITFWFIVNVPLFLDAANAVGQAFLALCKQAAVDAKLTPEQAKAILKSLTGKEDGGTWWRVQVAIALFIPQAMSMLCKVATKFLVIQLLIELLIRQALTPIFIANMYQEGLRSPGARHLKQYIAVYFKLGIVLIISVVAGGVIQTAVGAEASGLEAVGAGIGFVIQVIAVNFAAIGAMFKAGEYINAFTN